MSTTDPTLLTKPVMYDSALFLFPLHYQFMRGVCVCVCLDGACLVERGGAFLIYRIVKDSRTRFFCLRNGCVFPSFSGCFGQGWEGEEDKAVAS